MQESGGVLLVDKPTGWTSFDVVKKIRGMFRVRKVGHAGTLDPMATGLLILCSGSLTRSISGFQNLGKSYTGRCLFGKTTASHDADTPEIDGAPIDHLTAEEIQAVAQRFTGVIQQVPPMYSALKVEGRRLYQMARKGIAIEREPRTVEIRRFALHDFQPPSMRFEVECSKGTYIRSLIHDLGQALGVGAYVTELRRTAIGEHDVASAWTMDRLGEARARMAPGEAAA